MGKKLLSILLVVSIISSSVFGYDIKPSIAVITFQGPKEKDNVTISNLFTIELGMNSEYITVKSGKAIDSSYIYPEYKMEKEEFYSSLYSSNYENEAIKVAKSLRVHYVLIGQINKLGNTKKLIVKVIDVDNNYIGGSECEFVNIEDVEKHVKTISVKIINDIKKYNEI